MAQSKSGKKKDSSKDVVSKKDAEVKAIKALGRAETAVQLAADAVKGSRKKLRARADALAEQTDALLAKHAKAERKVEKAAKKANKAAALTVRSAVVSTQQPTSADGGSTVVISEVDESANTSAAPRTPEAASDFTPPLPSPKASAPTLITLRQRARSAKIPGYSRMNKAALLAALGDSAES